MSSKEGDKSVRANRQGQDEMRALDCTLLHSFLSAGSREGDGDGER